MKSADYDAFDKLSEEEQQRVLREMEEIEDYFEQRVRRTEEMETEQKAKLDATIEGEEEKKYLFDADEFHGLLEVCENAKGEVDPLVQAPDVDSYLRQMSGIKDLLHSEQLLSFAWGALSSSHDRKVKELVGMIENHFEGRK